MGESYDSRRKNNPGTWSSMSKDPEAGACTETIINESPTAEQKQVKGNIIKDALAEVSHAVGHLGFSRPW